MEGSINHVYNQSTVAFRAPAIDELTQSVLPLSKILHSDASFEYPPAPISSAKLATVVDGRSAEMLTVPTYLLIFPSKL